MAGHPPPAILHGIGSPPDPIQEEAAMTHLRSRLARLVLGAGLVTAVAVPLLTPGQAQAWWHRGGWGGVGFVVAPPVFVPPRPYYVAPPAPVYYAPPPAYYGPRWIPAHYNWRGEFIPGHYR
jgi:hypothetical protein